MPRNEDLHGNAPDKAAAALLLIDVINDLEFPEGEQLLRHALPMARQHRRRSKRRARESGIPAIYVNDNFGRWQSDFHAQVEHCLEDGVRGPAHRASCSRPTRTTTSSSSPSTRASSRRRSTSCSNTCGSRP